MNHKMIFEEEDADHKHVCFRQTVAFCHLSYASKQHFKKGNNKQTGTNTIKSWLIVLHMVSSSDLKDFPPTDIWCTYLNEHHWPFITSYSDNSLSGWASQIKPCDPGLNRFQTDPCATSTLLKELPGKVLTCCHVSLMSGLYRRKYFRGKLSTSGHVAGLCQVTSSRRALNLMGVAVTRSGGSGLTVGWEKKWHRGFYRFIWNVFILGFFFLCFDVFSADEDDPWTNKVSAKLPLVFMNVKVTVVLGTSINQRSHGIFSVLHTMSWGKYKQIYCI